MKRLELFFTALQLPVDYLLLVLAGLAAYNLRYAKFVTAIRPVLFNITWPRYWPIVAVVALGWVALYALSGLYSTNPNRKFARDITRIITASSTGFAAITIYVFFTLQKFDSRFLVLAGWILGMVFVILGRLTLRAVKSLLYRLGIGLRRVVTIGSGALIETLNTTFTKQSRFGSQLVASYPHFDATTQAALEKMYPDEILFADPKAHEDEALAAITFANNRHITFKYTADFFATVSSNMAIHTVAGIPVVELRRTKLGGWGRIEKRIFDIVGSVVLIIIFSPLYLLTALAVLLETGWPVLYRNERVGQHTKNFFTIKFRTMYREDSTGSEYGGDKALEREAELRTTHNVKPGPIYKIKNDPRITPLGKFLRRWSIDELPQFWNVLRGDMSLVGPRPHQPREVAGYGQHHSIIFAIKPGITGLAQISGRSDLGFEDEMRLDAFYTEHWGMFLDAIILLKTPFVVVTKRGSIV